MTKDSFSGRLSAILTSRHKKLPTQKAVGKAYGVSQESARKWLTGESTPRHSIIQKIAEDYGVRPSWLEHGDLPMYNDGENFVYAVVSEGKKIPVISYIQAGEWGEAIDIYEPDYADEFVPHVKGGDRSYALKVVGDSMTSPDGVSFPEGIIIHVDPDDPANYNDFVIAKLSGHDAVTFKQLKQGETEPYLNPLNKEHKKIYGRFRVIGKIVFAGWQF